MAEMMESGGEAARKKSKKVQSKKQSTRIDFTPMVDLGFLLITFFMLTTTLSKPQTMEINMPVKKDIVDSMKINEKIVMTLLLSENNRIFYYNGITDPKVEVTNYKPEGIRKVLLERNSKQVREINALKEKLRTKEIDETAFKDQVKKVKEDKDAVMVLIKADDKASYKNLVDILDEMTVCDVSRFAILDIQPLELEMIAMAAPKNP